MLLENLFSVYTTNAEQEIFQKFFFNLANPSAFGFETSIAGVFC
jgi:hypothetical protein